MTQSASETYFLKKYQAIFKLKNKHKSFRRLYIEYYQKSLAQNRRIPLNLRILTRTLDSIRSNKPEISSFFSLLDLFSYKMPASVSLQLLGLMRFFSKNKIDNKFYYDVLLELVEDGTAQNSKYQRLLFDWAVLTNASLFTFGEPFRLPAFEKVSNMLHFFQNSKKNSPSYLSLEPVLDSEKVQIYCQRRNQRDPFR